MGVNAVNRMVEAGITGVEFMAVNTDLQSLQQSAADLTVHIGGGVTRGLGSGSDPELGYRAAFEEQDRIKRMLKGSDMVFVAAGAGGGTGTGAAPVIARLARDVGALTVGIVTRPFGFEGTRRAKQADKGVDALAGEVDTLIVVPNDRLLSVLERNTSMVEAFRVADDVLRQGVQGISDLITLPALINLDFADVRTTMRDAGPALLGIGMGTGDTRAAFAAERAISSPLLETSIEGARSILLSITGGGDLSLVEISEAARVIQEAAHPEAHIIFGANVDETLDEQIWVTVIATRFDARGRRADGSSTGVSRSTARPSAPPRRELRRPARARLRGAPRRPRHRRSRVHPQLEPLARDARGVVAAGHPATAEAGAWALREGGNAVDAAIAAVLASVVDREPADRPRRRRLTCSSTAGRGRDPARLLRRRGRPRRARARHRARAGRDRLRRHDPDLQRRRRVLWRAGRAERACRRRRSASARCRSPTSSPRRSGSPATDRESPRSRPTCSRSWRRSWPASRPGRRSMRRPGRMLGRGERIVFAELARDARAARVGRAGAVLSR